MAPRGLGIHRRGRRCVVDTFAAQLRAAGLERASGYVPVLRRAGVEVTRRGTGFAPASRGRRAKITEQPWAPALAVALAKARAPVEVVREAHRFPDQAALQAVFLLGGAPAVAALFQPTLDPENEKEQKDLHHAQE